MRSLLAGTEQLVFSFEEHLYLTLSRQTGISVCKWIRLFKCTGQKMKGILFKQCAPKSQMIFLMSVFCKWKFSIFQRYHLFRGCVLSKSAFVAVHLHFCSAILPPAFSPWPPTLLYWIPIFAASTLSCISEGSSMPDAERSLFLLSTLAGLQVKRETQTISKLGECW